MCAPVSVSMSPVVPLSGVIYTAIISVITGVSGIIVLIKGLIAKSKTEGS